MTLSKCNFSEGKRSSDLVKEIGHAPKDEVTVSHITSSQPDLGTVKAVKRCRQTQTHTPSGHHNSLLKILRTKELILEMPPAVIMNIVVQRNIYIVSFDHFTLDNPIVSVLFQMFWGEIRISLDWLLSMDHLHVFLLWPHLSRIAHQPCHSYRRRSGSGRGT